MLIEVGHANVNYAVPVGVGDHPGCYSVTALMSAAQEGHANIVKALLDAYADVLHTTSNGHSALDLAIHFKHTAVIALIQARIGQLELELEVEASSK